MDKLIYTHLEVSTEVNETPNFKRLHTALDS